MVEWVCFTEGRILTNNQKNVAENIMNYNCFWESISVAALKEKIKGLSLGIFSCSGWID